jgi:hypothetical protein
MKRSVFLVVLAASVSFCSCTSRTATPGDLEKPHDRGDHQSFVGIAAIDPAKAEHVTRLLDANGIPSLVEGSVVYGVSMPPSLKDKAITILKADADKQSYYIKLWSPTPAPSRR